MLWNDVVRVVMSGRPSESFLANFEHFLFWLNGGQPFLMNSFLNLNGCNWKWSHFWKKNSLRIGKRFEIVNCSKLMKWTSGRIVCVGQSRSLMISSPAAVILLDYLLPWFRRLWWIGQLLDRLTFIFKKKLINFH